MRIYECPECGDVREAETWRYCAKSHKETPMYEIIEFGRSDRSNYLALKMKPKIDPLK